MIPGSLTPKETPPLSKEELEFVKSIDLHELEDILVWAEHLSSEDKILVRESVSGLKEVYFKDNPSTYEVRTMFKILKDSLEKCLEKNGYTKRQAA